MVLPLIPVALIAVGAITGGGGLALGGKGALDIKKASGQLKAAREQHEHRHELSALRVAATNVLISHYGQQQQQAVADVVVRMSEFLRRNQKKVRDSERLLVDGIDAHTTKVPGLDKLGLEATAWMQGAAGSASVAVGTATGTTAAIASFGVASTGTAITGLSGAAAQSATLAWLGGGSLAAGGWRRRHGCGCCRTQLRRSRASCPGRRLDD